MEKPEEQPIEQQEEDEELSAMKQRLQEMEQEAEKLREMQAAAEKDMNLTSTGESKEEVDSRSVYVGNVDYSTTPEEIQAYFQSCGTINRVTIICDKYTGHPKGFAYIEFADPSLIANAVVLSDSMFKGRQIKVIPKRTNVPGMNRGRGRGRGRGGYRGGYYGGGFRGRPSYRGRRGFYSPY